MAEGENPSDEDAAAAAEWEKMLAQDGGEGGADANAEGGTAEGEGGEAMEDLPPARVLNQDEIDSLLGFDSGDNDGPIAGIHAILDKSMTAYEKLPMLEVVFDRLVRTLSTSLRNFTSDNVDVSIDSMASLRFDDYLNSIPLPALLIVFRAVEWENYGLVMVDSSLIYSAVDILLGGRRAARPIRVEGRPYTTIEQDIIKRMVDIVLADMSAAFEPLSPATFQFERLETNPRFATITRPGNAALLVRLRVDMEERGGNIEILFPHASLEPIRDLLLQMFMGEKFGQDTVWERHLGNELRNTTVDVEVVLDEKQISLGDVMRFKVGSTLLLDCKPEDEVKLTCGGVGVTSGKLGRIGDTVAVSLSKPITDRHRNK